MDYLKIEVCWGSLRVAGAHRRFGGEARRFGIERYNAGKHDGYRWPESDLGGQVDAADERIWDRALRRFERDLKRFLPSLQ